MRRDLTIGSLFSGIGGLELGLEWAGLGPVVWQCEIDPFCRSVLAKHWPDVERFDDVTSEREWPAVDVVCGGFPCQDVSRMGVGAGLDGPRSGLWYTFAKIIDRVRPRFVVVENVASGKRKWLPTVRRDLHVLGYRSRAFALSAASVGAPHLRQRIFVVADTTRREGRAEGEALQGDGDRSVACKAGERRPRGPGGGSGSQRPESGLNGWPPEPNVDRVAHGLSGGVDGHRARLRALGNAVVPQCGEVAGRVLLALAETSK